MIQFLRIIGVAIPLVFATSLMADTPLTWGILTQLSHRSNPDIQRANSAVYIASQNYSAIQSDAAPHLTATIGMSQDLYNGAGSSHSQGLTLSQSLYPILAERPELDSALSEVVKAKANRTETLATVRQELANAYIALWAADNMVVLAKKITERRRKNLELVSARFNGGREHAGSKEWAKAQYENAKKEERQANRLAQVNRHILQVLVSANISTIAPISLDPKFSTLPPTPNFQSLIQSNPKVVAALATLQGAKAAQHATTLGHIPSLAGTISSSQSGPLSGNASPDNGLNLRLQLSIPLFNGGRYAIEDTIAQATIESSQSALNAVYYSVENALLQAWMDVQNAHEDLETQQFFNDAAQTRSEISTAQYSSGLLSYESWDIIETDVINQLRQVLERQKSLATAIAKWDRQYGKELE